MAKTSKIEKMKKQMRLAEKYRSRREALKARVIDTTLTMEERLEASRQLAKLPRNASPVRHRNRCKVTGRPRGYLRKFAMSRIALRELAHEGKIPGVTKSSW
ncbi:MAG: 30S ribosomal protein S14 [Candidatus Hydrogenedentes bacterium]|nr:30S ribosomal protein S14 [Candidatus Hydrogenedentota bacterium]